MLPRNWIRSIGATASSLAASVVFAAASCAASPLGADRFPNVELTTQDGAKVHFYDDLIKGKIVAIDFIYTHCDFECPLETARLAQVQNILGDRVGKDIFFYSISIDPDRDTPAVLKDYAEKFKVGPGWTFLTGRKEDIDFLALRLGMTDDPHITDAPGHDIDGHTPHLLIGNEATGQWLRDSSTDNPRFLARLIGNFVDTGAPPLVAARGPSDGSPFRVTAGQYLFAKECAACHSIGHGDKLGPDLKDVARIRDRPWLARYIAHPDSMLAAGDPIAKALHAKYKVTMPNLRVGDRDLDALLDFFAAQSARANPAQASVGAAPGNSR
jgi:protein SCO1/2